MTRRLSWIPLLLLLACSENPEEVAAPRYTLELVSGGDQSAVVGTALPEPLVFRLHDQHGEALGGRAVEFLLSQGSGSFSPEAASTDAQGRVSTQLSLGTVAGALVVSPEVPGLDDLEGVDEARATALPDAPAALAWVLGDGQKDAPGATLQVDLVLAVQDVYGNATGGGTTVHLSASDDSEVDPLAEVQTDAEGYLSCWWTLGSELGEYTLGAESEGLQGAVATATADLAPSITGVTHGGVVAEGDPVYVIGERFCARPEHNTLTLGGAPMTVTEASETALTGLVPAGLALGEHELSLRVGSQEAPEHYQVEVSLPLGRVEDFPFVGDGVEISVSALNASAEYVAIVYSLRDTYTLPQAVSLGPAEPLPPREREAVLDPVQDFLRRLLQVRGSGGPGPLPTRSRTRETREFHVFSDIDGNTVDPGAYSTVTADLGYEGVHVQIYVDERDQGSLSAGRLAELGQTFDSLIYPTDRSAFGAESDYDLNERVMVLLTRVVNELTGQIDDDPQWQGAYVGGFFNPVDLPIWSWPDGTSNGGEVFYGLVPDPSGEYSEVEHTEEEAVSALKPIIAHEFQHMINWHQRHYVYGGGDTQVPQEELWINEGLSHLAEDLCGFQEQNVDRVSLYLHGGRHAGVSLASLSGTPGGAEVGNSLQERGASYLFIRYLADRWPGSPMDLVKSTISGRDNVEQATGEHFEQVFKDWLAAIYLDGRDYADDPRYQYTSLDIRSDFPYSVQLQEPLAIADRNLLAPAWTTDLVAMSFDLVRLHGPAPGGLAELRFGGDPEGAMGVLLIRTGL